METTGDFVAGEVISYVTDELRQSAKAQIRILPRVITRNDCERILLNLTLLKELADE